MIFTNTSFISPPPLNVMLNAQAVDIWGFLGRFHPLIVHLPIGFLLVVVTLEYLSTKKNFSNLRHAVPFVLGMTSVSSIFAAVLGYFLSLEGGYEENILFWHKWFGIALAAGSTIAWVFRYKLEKNSSRNFRLAYISFLIISFLLLIGTGHQGGSLTHGSDYLTSAMPNPLRNIAGLPPKAGTSAIKVTNIKEALAYQHIIQPILNERCINCHGTSKKKGDLMLNTLENIFKGGENGKVISPPQPLKSKLYTYLLLPEGDDRHMPPKGKIQLSKEEIRLIGWWIAQGAPVDKKIADLKIPDSISTALIKVTRGDSKPEGIFAKEVKPASDDLIVELRQSGLKLKSISADVNYLQAGLASQTDTFGLKEAKSLLKIAPQLVWLDLGNKKVTNEALELLGGFPNLSRLHLENTDVRDDMLAHVSALKNLEYLNLYGTGITNLGIKHLRSLKKLRYIYLWQTKVTFAEASKLRKKANASLEINMGRELNQTSGISAIN